MRVPGTFCIGAPMYSLNTASFQVMPEPFMASEKLYPSNVPALRPSIPLSGGPSLIFASAPASWQGRHHLRKVASVCAIALPAEATPSNEANIQGFIRDLLSPPPTPFLGERVPLCLSGPAARQTSTAVRMAFGVDPVNAPGMEFH